MLIRHMMYHKMKLAEGYSLIEEVHQESELYSVDFVAPEIPEAEAMFAMMNKQLLVYLSNYLADAGMGKVFVKALIKGAIWPSLNHADGTCTWDSINKTVTTPEDAEREQQQVLEDLAWYKDEYGDHMSTRGRQKKKEYSSPEIMYDIEGEHSVKKIHEHPGKGYDGTPGAATIDLQRKPKSKEDIVDDEYSKGSSDISNMLRYQLIARLCKHGNISDSYQVPAPQSVKCRSLTLISSSDESDSSQKAANIRYFPPSFLLGLQEEHSNKRQAVRGKQSIIWDAWIMKRKGK